MSNCPHYITDRYHPLPPSYIPGDLIRSSVPFIAPISDMKRCVSKVMYEPLQQLFRACLKDGLFLMGVSAFRSYERQKEIYDDSMIRRGKTHTNSHIAFPGTSEHQTGLAIDLGLRQDHIDFICPEFPDTGICRLFREKASDYGFILRYPPGKEHITGISHEPWHFRYVGRPHAQIMEQEGLTLEEYVARIG